MKIKPIFFTFFIIIVLQPLICLENYNIIKLNSFTNGNGKNQLGYFFPVSNFPHLKAPNTITVNNEGNIIVCDQINYRVVTYDLNFIYLSERIVNNDNMILYCDRYIFDYKENIIGIAPLDGLIKTDKNFNKLFFIYRDIIENQVMDSYNVFPFKEYLLYYDNKKKLHFLDSKGMEIDRKEIEVIKRTVKNEYPGILRNDLIEKYLEENDLILLGDRLLSTDEVLVYNFFKLLQSTMKNRKFKRNLDQINAYNIQTYIGFDKNDNSYWTDYNTGNTLSTIVLSKHGEVLAHFFDPYNTDTLKTISPNGDIYYLFFNDKTRLAEAYKIPRQWGLDQDWGDAPPESPKTPKALFITATSFIDWKNTYTPAKAFDGNLNTGWLEAAKGPGTGESITLKLNRVITVDEIHIAPGYFDPKWWKSNNRVKSLKVTYGLTSRDIHFKDEMKKQEVKFPSEAQFSEIIFEISSVYPSRKYNDAGISEIEFYYKGEKVEIDVSGVK